MQDLFQDFYKVFLFIVIGFLAVLFGYPTASLKFGSTYIFPNNEKSLVILLVPWSGLIPREFEHYSAFYELTKALYLGLKDIPQ